MAPADAELRFRVTDTESWLGVVAERLGNYPEAIERFRAEAEGLDALIQIDPNAMRWRFEKADNLSFQASVQAITGARSEAHSRLTEARGIIDQLLVSDPANREWTISALRFRLRHAQLLLAERRHDDAQRLAVTAQKNLDALMAAETTNRRIRPLLALSWRIQAEVLLAQGRPGAERAADRAAELGESQVRAVPAGDVAAAECAQAHITAARIADSLGNRESAKKHADRALELLRGSMENTSDWRFLDSGARALSVAGKADAARSMIERLDQIGYRPLEPWPELASSTFLPSSTATATIPEP